MHEPNLNTTKNFMCNKITWIGEYIISEEFNQNLICTNRKHNFTLDFNTNALDIEVISKATIKQITISSKSKFNYYDYSYYLYELLRYENIFDGRFYHQYNLYLDDKKIDDLNKDDLPYYRSKQKYLFIGIIYDNHEEYKSLFLKWLEISKKYSIIHQMFLYACYANDITPDVKLALLLQTFEPIANMLHEEKKIQLIKQPTITIFNKCDICNNIISIQKKNNKLYFSDRLNTILEKYGNQLFKLEDREMLVDKAVKTRNKIVHLDTSVENTMKGEESGVYLYKFALLYRIIILKELDLDEEVYNNVVNDWATQFDNKYIDYLITKQK